MRSLHRCAARRTVRRCAPQPHRHRLYSPLLVLAGQRGWRPAALACTPVAARDWGERRSARFERRWQSSSAAGGHGDEQRREQTQLLNVDTTCTLQLALQLLRVGVAQPESVTGMTSLPASAPLAAHVEAVVLDAIHSGEATAEPRDDRWRERLYDLWSLPSSELQEMLALRGLDYKLHETPSESELLPTDSSDGGKGELAYRMVQYEQELAAFNADDDEFGDDMFGPSGGDAGGTWQLSSGASADAAALEEFEALVGVVRGQLAVHEQLSEAVELLQVRPLQHAEATLRCRCCCMFG
eukprot:COSAG02_NODE_159_length_32891_cov_17.822518_21_plen_298_part_00